MFLPSSLLCVSVHVCISLCLVFLSLHHTLPLFLSTHTEAYAGINTNAHTHADILWIAMINLTGGCVRKVMFYIKFCVMATLFSGRVTCLCVVRFLVCIIACKCLRLFAVNLQHHWKCPPSKRWSSKHHHHRWAAMKLHMRVCVHELTSIRWLLTDPLNCLSAPSCFEVMWYSMYWMIHACTCTYWSSQ